MDRQETRFQGTSGYGWNASYANASFNRPQQQQRNNNNNNNNNNALSSSSATNSGVFNARETTFLQSLNSGVYDGTDEKLFTSGMQQQQQNGQPAPSSNDGFLDASFGTNACASPIGQQQQQCCHHPLRVLLVRHGQAESNVDKTVYRHKPDHAISLTEDGKEMARRTGKAINEYLTNTFGTQEESLQHIRLVTSPFLRTRQTAECILEGMRSGQLETWNSLKETFEENKAERKAAEQARVERLRKTANPSAQVAPPTSEELQEEEKMKKPPTFWVDTIRESPFLAEQDFGALEGTGEMAATKYAEETKRMKLQRDFQGAFWARAPQGESYFQVCNRLVGVVSDIVNAAKSSAVTTSRSKPVRTVIVVTHGITLRAFLSVWCHYTPEWLASSSNPPNCAVRLLVGSQDCGYLHSGWNSSEELRKFPNGINKDEVRLGHDYPKDTWNSIMSRIRDRTSDGENGATEQGQQPQQSTNTSDELDGNKNDNSTNNNTPVTEDGSEKKKKESTTTSSSSSVKTTWI